MTPNVVPGICPSGSQRLDFVSIRGSTDVNRTMCVICPPGSTGVVDGGNCISGGISMVGNYIGNPTMINGVRKCNTGTLTTLPNGQFECSSCPAGSTKRNNQGVCS